MTLRTAMEGDFLLVDFFPPISCRKTIRITVKVDSFVKQSVKQTMPVDLITLKKCLLNCGPFLQVLDRGNVNFFIYILC